MNTHDLAKALTVLARILRTAPNQPLEALRLDQGPRLNIEDSDIPVALNTLVALSDIDKSQWLRVISEYGFPITIRPRDASRDIVGKVLTFLMRNPSARKRLAAASSPRHKAETSPELMRALQALLEPKQ
jgi:hypothetical protein